MIANPVVAGATVSGSRLRRLFPVSGVYTVPTSVIDCHGKSEADLLAIPGFIYIGRPMRRDKRPTVRKGSPFQNPRLDMVAYYHHVLNSPELVALLPTLAGPRLGCWCCDCEDAGSVPPQDWICHGMVLAFLADGHRL